MLTRRSLLGGVARALALPALVAPRLTFAAPAAGDARFVLVLLRGAVDGLSFAPPVGDPDYARVRGTAALSTAPGLTRLDDLFALHPSLRFVAERWREGEAALVHAVATPYRERSHFEAQDVLETGHARPHAARSGWLNRALAGLPAARRAASVPQGVALGAAVPLVMRGAAEVASWSPGRLPHVEEDTLQRFADLYAGDALLARRLAEATQAQAIAGGGAQRGGGRAMALAQFQQLSRMAASFLVREQGPRVAVLETSGWDTHAAQGDLDGALAARLAALDTGLRVLREGLGDAWRRTVVLAVTEFGRTVAVNGTRGTDHGTGAAALLVGGAVRGRVVADWPGLSPPALHQGRDLAPTLDLRAVEAAVLREHLGISQEYIMREVFPDAARLARIDGLVRS
jgi:uncharacterized protein (DUF1501 family)